MDDYCMRSPYALRMRRIALRIASKYAVGAEHSISNPSQDRKDVAYLYAEFLYPEWNPEIESDDSEPAKKVMDKILKTEVEGKTYDEVTDIINTQLNTNRVWQNTSKQQIETGRFDIGPKKPPSLIDIEGVPKPPSKILEDIVKENKEIFKTTNWVEAISNLQNAEKSKPVIEAIVKNIKDKDSDLRESLKKYTDKNDYKDVKDFLVETIKKISPKSAQFFEESRIISEKEEFFRIFRSIIEEYQKTDVFDRAKNTVEAVSFLNSIGDTSKISNLGKLMQVNRELRNPTSRIYKLLKQQGIADNPVEYFKRFLREVLRKNIVLEDDAYEKRSKEENPFFEAGMITRPILSSARRKSIHFWMTASL